MLFLEEKTFPFELSFEPPFLWRAEDCSNRSRNQFDGETGKKGKGEIKYLMLPKILEDLQGLLQGEMKIEHNS